MFGYLATQAVAKVSSKFINLNSNFVRKCNFTRSIKWCTYFKRSGTQCAKLAARFQLNTLSTGDLIREVLKEDSPLATEIRTSMEQGGLVDTRIVLKLLVKAMEDVYPYCRGYLIDGYPREVKQGKLLCKEIGKPHVIVYLDCPAYNILLERLSKRGKNSDGIDDNEETVEQRLETFHRKSKPVIEHWKSKVVKVDATRSPEEVEKECIQAIRTVFNDFRYNESSAKTPVKQE